MNGASGEILHLIAWKLEERPLVTIQLEWGLQQRFDIEWPGNPTGNGFIYINKKKVRGMSEGCGRFHMDDGPCMDSHRKVSHRVTCTFKGLISQRAHINKG